MPQVHALVIEDNARNISVIGSLLAKQGITHTGLLDPINLEETLAKLEFLDLVFLDLEMPNRNGYEVIESLKTDPRFRTIPIVAYTVHLSEMNTAYQYGFHSFLPKPIDPDRFPEQVSRILKGERIWERV